MAMTFEMNNVRRDSDITLTNEIKHSSPIVEIFSALTDGKDTSKYGKKTDAVVNKIKELGLRVLLMAMRSLLLSLILSESILLNLSLLPRYRT